MNNENLVIEIFNNNPSGAMQALGAMGLPSSEQQALPALIEMLRVGDYATLNAVLSQIPFVDNKDMFSAWVISQTPQKRGFGEGVSASEWIALGGSVLTAVGTIGSGSGGGQQSGGASNSTTTNNNAGGSAMASMELKPILIFGGIALVGFVLIQLFNSVNTSKK